MNDILELLGRAVLIGIGATAVMDLWLLFARRVLRVPTLDLALLGRWIGHFVDGKFVHRSIAAAPRVRGERLLGWGAHYAIGVGFAALLLSAWGAGWARAPSLLPALLVGVVTVAAPFFILQPAMGAGVAASRTASPGRARLRSVVTHTVFGLGLYLAAELWAALLG